MIHRHRLKGQQQELKHILNASPTDLFYPEPLENLPIPRLAPTVSIVAFDQSGYKKRTLGPLQSPSLFITLKTCRETYLKGAINTSQLV